MRDCGWCWGSLTGGGRRGELVVALGKKRNALTIQNQGKQGQRGI